MNSKKNFFLYLMILNKCLLLFGGSFRKKLFINKVNDIFDNYID